MNAFYLRAALALAATVAGLSVQAQPAVTSAVAEMPISPEATRSFPAKVQPVLMNLCAQCHCRSDHPSAFKLSRVDDGYANAQITSRNLRAAAVFVQVGNPAASPLLMKAVTPHGGAKDPPLFGRSHPAFKNLEGWASQVSFGAASKKPDMIITSTPPSTATAASVNPLSAPTSEPAKLPPLPQAEALPPPETHDVSPVVNTKLNTDDPYDPAVFNRAIRGGK